MDVALARVLPAPFFFGGFVADSEKRINCIKVCFDDNTFLAIGRMAAREDRKVADLVHSIVRRYLYGNYERMPVEAQGTDADQ